MNTATQTREYSHTVAPGHLSLRILRNAEAVERFRSAWERLQWHPNADIDFFLLINTLRKQEPYVVVILQGEEVVAIAAARLVDARHRFAIGYRTLYAPKVKELMLIHGGVMGNISPAIGSLMFEGLTKALREKVADVLSLWHIRSDSILFELSKRYRPFICRDYVPREQPHYELVLPESIDRLFSNLKSKRRSELRRLPKVLEKDFPGKVRIQCFESTEDAVRFCSEAEQVASRSYLRALGVGFVNNEESQETAKLSARQGCFVGYILYAMDKPCAFWSAQLCSGVGYLWSTAFDPQFHKYEVGTILLVNVIEDIVKRKQDVAKIDFGLGDARYKSLFGTDKWQEVSLYLFASSFRAVSINLVRTPLLASTRVAQSVLKRLRLEERLKRLWRRRARKHLGQ
jgi:ribosomal protein S18 acetylase RimI-like enzyme